MKIKNKLFIRNLIANESYNLFKKLLESDPFVEKIIIPIKFKKTNSYTPFYYKTPFKTLPSESAFKSTINKALNETSEHYRKNKFETSGDIMIVFIKYLNHFSESLYG